MTKIKNLKQKIVAIATIAVLSIGSAVTCLASTVDPYADVTAKLTEETGKMFASAQTMVLATIGAGLVIFGIFLLFKLGKKAIGAATGGK